jgi:hypothetical protein
MTQKAMLPLCPSLEYLWLYNLGAVLIPLIGDLPLRRLSVSAVRMPIPPGCIFSHLTHLHLGGVSNLHVGGIYKVAEDACAFIAALPKLTHLSMNSVASVLVSHKILELSPSICVLVFFEHHRRIWSAVGELPQDMRFVVMPPRHMIHDWYAGIQYGTDCWSDAEAFVAERRTRELDPA